ncbi:MAG: HD domain-containing protein [Alphaproteobacteria bacterium]|nr:HD domain-containing protein [Alphaproteobacteria bacterium]
MEVRDPIHGAIELDDAEASLIHQPFVQRLRGIRQVGFSSLPFPGAVHSRFAHVLGVMHVAGRAFDRAYRDWTFDQPDARARFRAAVRLAALCHDLGHAPYSHCTEFAMPPVRALGIDWYRTDPGERRASHEDYTIAILEHSALAAAIDASFPCTARHVAALVSDDVRVPDDFFRDGGLDHRRLLSQIISSELDADRLDYLVRDATYTGAQYGLVDVGWILSNLSTHAAHGQVWLALDSGAIYAFEDFLVARHHMFLQVYFHHKSVVYEEMLKRYVHAAGGGWAISADLDAYLYQDDVALDVHLRQVDDPWARRIVEHREYRRVVERHGVGRDVDVGREARQLEGAGIDTIVTESTGRLSRYALGRRDPSDRTIFVRERLPGQKASRTVRLDEASGVFERYADAHRIARIYVAPERRDAAFEVLGIRRG